MNDDQQPDYDEDGIQWFPTESLYAAPDVVPQQPPTNDLSNLRAAVEHDERLHWHLDQTGFSTDGSLAKQRRLQCTTVIIAPEVFRDESNHDGRDDQQ